ncbi:hypothetical protein AAF712_016541 [Marasmius tenuissimus]|uniref:Uncharacterized protein n=1 Tax=Marasmius tenuissimus TaxID=585030 RepID=A0ABR2Z5Q4_9AGAR
MLQMKSVCVGFHTSAHLCSAFINILDRVDVTEKENNLGGLHAAKWDLLKDCKKVLDQYLSRENVPTLCDALLSFGRIIHQWMEIQKDLPHLKNAIEAGIVKIK